jgi:hypothetical protein
LEPSFVVAPLPLHLSPLLLLLGAALATWLERRGKATWFWIALASLAAAVVPLALAAAPAARGAYVLDLAHVRLFRVGSFDAVVAVHLDRTALLGATAVLLLTGGAVLGSLQRSSRGTASPATAGEALLVGALALAAALSDGFTGMFLFGSLLALALTLRDGAALRLASLVLVGAAVALLSWALGGQWLDDARYLSDYRARFAIAGEAPRAKGGGDTRGDGMLTIVSHPGADLHLGVATESQLARSSPFARTPALRIPVPAGLQKIAIVPGDGAIVSGEGVEAVLLDAVQVRPGEELVVTAVGPTLTFHEIDAQVDARGVFHAIGNSPSRPLALQRRRVGDERVGPIGAGLVALAAVAAALGVGLRGALQPLAGTFSIVMAMLVMRLSPIYDPESTIARFAMVALAIVAGLVAWRRVRTMLPAAALAGVASLSGNGGAAILTALGMGLVAACVATRTDGHTGEGPESSKTGAKGASIVDHALGVTIPVFGVGLPVACVAITGFATSVTQGLLVAATTAVAWASSALALREHEPWSRLSALTALAVAAPLVATLVFRPYVVDGSLGRGALLFAVAPWLLVLLAVRLSRGRAAIVQPEASDATPASLELVWAASGVLFDWPTRVFARAGAAEERPAPDSIKALPETTEPEPTEPETTEPETKPTKPKPSEPKPSEPKPSEPKPSRALKELGGARSAEGASSLPKKPKKKGAR